jgi:hypothetical protein
VSGIRVYSCPFVVIFSTKASSSDVDSGLVWTPESENWLPKGRRSSPSLPELSIFTEYSEIPEQLEYPEQVNTAAWPIAH